MAIPWLAEYLATNPLDPRDNNYHSLNVDGGLINNEPFEKVQDILLALTEQTKQEQQSFANTRSTILMIEPFPTSKSAQINKDQAISNVIGLTLSTMRSQMRSKPVHLEDAFSEDCAAQYLITPSRKLTKDGDTELNGESAIACGALSRFSGFINKEFRVHDYFLGRYNCKIFLRDYFTVPKIALEKNKIFREGYENANQNSFCSQVDGSLQIIPVFEDSTDYTFPDFKFSSGTNWPTLTDNDIDQYKDKMKSRVKAVLPNLLSLNLILRIILAIVSFSEFTIKLQTSFWIP
ncbi:hypothetical protein [Mucilaginibacter sp. SP1R1]|uniref:hypothetical protein n=1 Tax=Mucilaginibacter sp. SP1R1 TaxID=2723091 RepID=UPI00160AC021|nr:hypothetical protein [Mucilaginibacter sp. SP1R1]MBB6152375.1 hypothetical protein [Mucilaginibacter sp. SP1R1]